MPFHDATLAATMQKFLVVAAVMSDAEQRGLLRGPLLEVVVENTLKTKLVKFKNPYWIGLGQWIRREGGDISKIDARRVPGRVIADLDPPIVLYSDCFYDVNQHIDKPSFSAAKAVTNHLRMIKVFLNLS